MPIKFWRRFNTILLLFAFYAPWLRFCGNNRLNGYQTTLIFADAIADLGNQPNGFAPLIFVGLICILLYSLLNLIFSFGLTTQIVSRLRIGTLICGVLGMLSLAFASLSDSSTDDFLWGYWLTWAGLLSGLGVEITEGGAKITNVSDG